VNSRRTKIEDIIGFAQEIFRIRGISACSAEEMEGKPRNALEAAFETYLEAYGPYMRTAGSLGVTEPVPSSIKKGIRCPT